MATKKTQSKAEITLATLTELLNKHAAVLKSHEEALKAHAAAIIAITPAEARGACSIIYTDGRTPECVDNQTNRECQERAAANRGTAWPIVPGQKCFTGQSEK